MSDRKEKTRLVELIVEGLPSSINKSLLEDHVFREKFNIRIQRVLSFSPNAKFERDILLASVAKVTSYAEPVGVMSLDGIECTVQLVSEEDVPTILIVAGEEQLRSSHLALACANADARKKAFKVLTNRFHDSENVVAVWRGRIEAASLTAAMLDDLFRDLAATPGGFLENLSVSFARGTLRADDLFPEETGYFATILPAVGAATDFADYASNILTPYQGECFEKDPVHAISRALAFSASERLVPIKAFGEVNFNILEKLEIKEISDPFSLVALLSLCCFQYSTDERFLGPIQEIVERLVGDRNRSRSVCEVFAGIYMLTLARLSRSPEFTDSPVYYRRLAAFGHASLCTRELVADRAAPSDNFYQWCLGIEGINFFAISILDKGDAPRWRQEWVQPNQILNELIGRLNLVADKYPNVEALTHLKTRVSDFQKTLGESFDARGPYFPGPLEGTRQVDDARAELPAEILQGIEKATTGKVGIERCIGIVAAAPIWEVPDQLIDDATRELDRSPIPSFGSGGGSFVALLGGLAHLAGIKQSSKLANLVASLGLRALRLRQDGYSVSRILPEVLEASAAFPEHVERQKWLSNVMTIFAFAIEDDAQVIMNTINAFSIYDRVLGRELLRAYAAASALAALRPQDMQSL